MPPLFFYYLGAMKALALFICIFMCASFGFAQKILIPFRDKDLWGYADTNGVIQIKPAFDKVKFFNYSRPTAEVYRNKKISLIDTLGNVLFPFSNKIERFGHNYVLVQDGKRGMYSPAGKLLVPVEYDWIHYTFSYDEYKSEKDKVIGVKNDNFYLVSLITGKAQQIAKPAQKDLGPGVGVAAPPDHDPDGVDIVSIPFPQYPSSDFPALAGQKNLVHCETIRMNTKPVFYVFCVWRDRKVAGYAGQNGVLFFKD